MDAFAELRLRLEPDYKSADIAMREILEIIRDDEDLDETFHEMGPAGVHAIIVMFAST